MQPDTPHLSERAGVVLAGKRYFVAAPDQAREVNGRAWRTQLDTDQDLKPRPFTLSLESFHEGCGFTWASVPHVYEHADQWDASVPGMIRTVARHAAGAAVVASNHYGWLKYFGDRLVMARDRYISKYTPTDTPGLQWNVAQSHDLGANHYVPGRPEVYDGELYVPDYDDGGGAADVFQNCDNLATDNWADGPKTALGFRRWAATSHPFVRIVPGGGVATAAADPMTANNWSDDGSVAYQVGDPGREVIDLGIWDRYLIASKPEGLYSFDENLYTVLEVPDLDDILDAEAGRGMETALGPLFAPHDAGLLMWQPQSYRFVGPEQEGGLEGDLSVGWGRATCVIPFGRFFIVAHHDEENSRGSVVLYYPTRGGRGPFVPHMLAETTGGHFEGGAKFTDAGIPYFAIIRVNTAGTSATPWVWKLPRAALSPAQDPNIDKAVSSATLATPRYMQPGHDLQKTWRCVEAYLEFTSQSAHAGFQVWASIDGGAFFQLTDSDLATAKTVLADGFYRFWFPAATNSGRYVQLEFRVPAGTAVGVTMRQGALKGTFKPIRTNVYETTLILTMGEFEDGSSMQRDPETQLADLLALYGKDGDAFTFEDPFGIDAGYAAIEELQWGEHRFKGAEESSLYAVVTLREETTRE